eukprot:405845-Prymnesium_polylepis.1
MISSTVLRDGGGGGGAGGAGGAGGCAGGKARSGSTVKLVSNGIGDELSEVQLACWAIAARSSLGLAEVTPAYA